MTVYADILILLNLLIDYFLLSLSAHLLREKITFFRQLLGAVFGGIYALILFLPDPPLLLRILSEIAACMIMTALAVAKISAKRYFRFAAVLFAVSCGYAGGMMALWQLIHPNGMVVHNSIVYFDISPLFLILFSVAAYFIILLVRSLVERSSACAKRCQVRLIANGRQIDLCAIADTGNSLQDAFGISEVIIADRAAATALFGENLSAPELKNRYRVLPCNTVSGDGLLDGWRCDKAYITAENETVELRHPILAVAKTPLGDDYSAIINPQIIESIKG